MSRHNSRKEEDKRFAMERKREKDTVYFLEFTPKNGGAAGYSTLLDNPWCVRLWKNSMGDADLKEAIRTFETRHGVDLWTEVASGYKVNSFWYS
ncbi:hypothetical protein EI77_00885 [Prosthecobacter fusiformis]|uniref:Uncharacterized protein n=1 Tax=Prosthecobacter fusiformis TaxID=48464 RepID=A0A4R7SS65_9BACT|nr:hypothetical protein [Prosthecobacter fusiformis]TDU81575.1 hypothetical protein EI77_00885 [Prosthecobacter fusiformis]